MGDSGPLNSIINTQKPENDWKLLKLTFYLLKQLRSDILQIFFNYF